MVNDKYAYTGCGFCPSQMARGILAIIRSVGHFLLFPGRLGYDARHDEPFSIGSVWGAYDD